MASKGHLHSEIKLPRRYERAFDLRLKQSRTYYFQKRLFSNESGLLNRGSTLYTIQSLRFNYFFTGIVLKKYGWEKRTVVCLSREAFFFFLSVAKEATRFGQLYENKVSTIALPPRKREK